MGQPEYTWGEKGDEEALNPVGRKNQPKWPCCKCPGPTELRSSIARGEVPPALEKAAADAMGAIEKQKNAAEEAIHMVDEAVEATNQKDRSLPPLAPDAVVLAKEQREVEQEVVKAAQADVPVVPPGSSEAEADAAIVATATQPIMLPSQTPYPLPSSTSKPDPTITPGASHPARVLPAADSSASPLPARVQAVVAEAEAVRMGRPPMAVVPRLPEASPEPVPDRLSPWREIKAVALAEEMRERVVATGALMDEAARREKQ